MITMLYMSKKDLTLHNPDVQLEAEISNLIFFCNKYAIKNKKNIYVLSINTIKCDIFVCNFGWLT